MEKFILATKEKMTQVFNEDGSVAPATLVAAGPMTAVQIKTKDKDGYSAVLFGFGSKKENKVKKPQRKLGAFKVLRELKTNEPSVSVGDKIDAAIFSEGDKIKVSGTGKGKGFQGVVKRHGFKGGPRTHGQKHSEREPGSIGGGARAAGRVAKGMRMAGRMGGGKVTVKNLKVLKIDAEKGEMLISGALPGRKGTLLEIYGA